jgi:hypothetical protein
MPSVKAKKLERPRERAISTDIPLSSPEIASIMIAERVHAI